MTLGSVVNAEEALRKVMNSVLPADRVFKVRRVVKPLTDALKEYHEARNNYIREHGTTNKGGTTLSPESEAWEGFIAYMNELLSEEIDPPERKLRIEDLGKIELTIADVDALEDVGLIKE